ncbi:GGDEF domain-containing protein [Pelomonas sp. SE-A7]|uniref:GGDEF domain-containing protein n=1 Tax=Pelomonas sp. SE-A7 TaxID=3054953 RepID=UPI00259CB274|nr:GGDEF domain-containing protein [Pelomonas sp. SE-A7]MDM4768433.1 GGDEF domain-containing protein [Pelomonas sp. SE-A7]
MSPAVPDRCREPSRMPCVRQAGLAFVALSLCASSIRAAGPALESVADFEARFIQLVRAGKSESAARYGLEVIQRAQAARDKNLEGLVHLRLNLVRDAFWPEYYEGVRQHVQQAEQLLSASSGLHAQALLHVGKANALRGQRKLPEAMDEALKAVAMAESSGDGADQVWAFIAASGVAAEAGIETLAIRYARGAVEVGGLAPTDFAMLRARLNLVSTLFRFGQGEGVVQPLREIATAAQSVGDLRSEVDAESQLVVILPPVRSAESLKAFRKVVDLTRRMEDRNGLALSLANLSDMETRLGQPAAGLRSAQEALELAELTGAPKLTRIMAMHNKGLALVKLGRQAEGFALLEAASNEDPIGSDEVAHEYAFVGKYKQAYEHLQRAMKAMEAGVNPGDQVAQVSQRQAADQIARLEAENRLAKANQRLVLSIALGGALLVSVIVAALLLRQRLLKRHASQLGHVNRQLESLALTDSLTGLHNRRYFMERIAKHVAAVERTSTELNFFLIDLDHFKRINDSLGHASGDEVLKQAAVRLSALVRSEDELVRWGGEEFLLLTRGSNREHAYVLAERVRAAMAETPFELASGPLSVSCSIGLAAYPLRPGSFGAPPWQAVLELADQALYRVKQRGRNGWSGLWSVNQPLAGVTAETLQQGLESGAIELRESSLASPEVALGAA